MKDPVRGMGGELMGKVLMVSLHHYLVAKEHVFVVF